MRDRQPARAFDVDAGRRPCLQSAEQRTADVDHEQQVGQPASDRQERAEQAALGRRHHRRQQDPGARVVDGGAGQRHRPQPGIEQPGVVDDPRQHRERRDGDGRRDEQTALPVHDLVREVPAEADHPPSDEASEDQRNTDAGGRGDTGLPRVRAEDVELERRAHQKHVEHESELADDVDDHEVRVRERLGADGQLRGEQPLLRGGPYPAQYRRAEQESGHHHRDYLHLSESAEQRPQQAIGQEYDGDLEEEVGGDREQ